MIHLVKRNLKLYFRDRVAVFFSLLSVLIVIGLYAFFLSDTLKGSSDFAMMKEADLILNRWILAGLLSIVSISTTLASYGVMVNDRSTNIMKDFYSSSMKRWKLVVAYVLAACVTGLIMSLVTLFVGEIYIVINGGELITFDVLIKVLGCCIVSVISGSSLMFLLASFLQTSSAFSNASTIVGTLVGFVMGIYMPVGQLPEFAQGIVKVFPLSYGTASFRQLLLGDTLTEAFKGAPASVVASFEESMGITIYVQDTLITINMSIAIMLVSAMVCIALSVLVFRIKKK